MSPLDTPFREREEVIDRWKEIGVCVTFESLYVVD